MIKDFRYIIKRVIIGVLICVAISCINSCKVKALEWNQLDLVSSIRVNSNLDVYGSIYIDKSTDTYYLRSTLNSDTNFNYKIENASNYPYILCATDNANTNTTPNSGNDSTTQIRCFFTNEPLKYVWYGDLGGNSSDRRLVNNELDNHYYLTRFNRTASNSAIFNDYSLAKPQNYSIGGNTYTLTVYGSQLYRNSVILSNYDIYFYDRDELYQSKNLDFTTNEPSIVDIEYIPYEVNNILTEVSLFPEFTFFDTEKYDYQYGFATDNDIPNVWLSLEQNSQWLRFRANGTLFVRIKDKQTNEIIDSSTFTIDNIGRLVEDEDSYIDITSEYRTENYLNNKTKKGTMSTIVENQLYIDYNPKSSYYKYYYQYIPADNEEYATTPNDNNWEELASSNNGSRTYVVSQNGVLFAKMEDKDGNVVATANYKVDNIGILATDNPNENEKSAWYYRIGKKLNFGGPIGSLINIPISLISTLYSRISNSNTCTMYSLGTLWGTTLHLPCVNLRTYLGSLYNVIDLILSGVMIYFLAKMIMRTYNNFLSLNKDPVNIEKGGDS